MSTHKLGNVRVCLKEKKEEVLIAVSKRGCCIGWISLFSECGGYSIGETGKRSPSIVQSRAMRGDDHGSCPLTKERFLECAVGKCPEVEISIGRITVRCLLDTGSNVSTLMESFFSEHLHGEDRDMHRDQKDGEAELLPPGTLGINIAQRCRQLILVKFDNALKGALDSDWQDALSKVQEATSEGVQSIVRIAGKVKTHVPAGSVNAVQGQAHKELPRTNGVVILKPGKMPLPGGLVLLPTVVYVVN